MEQSAPSVGLEYVICKTLIQTDHYLPRRGQLVVQSRPVSCIFLAHCRCLSGYSFSRYVERSQVQQRGIAGCVEVIQAIFDGVLEASQPKKVFVVDLLPQRPAEQH